MPYVKCNVRVSKCAFSFRFFIKLCKFAYLSCKKIICRFEESNLKNLKLNKIMQKCYSNRVKTCTYSQTATNFY